MGKKAIRSVALLRALRADGSLAEEVSLKLEDYYEGLHNLVDSDEYRAKLGIVLLEGKLYDSAGKLDQEFENRYSNSGRYIGGRTIHDDGTVTED